MFHRAKERPAIPRNVVYEVIFTHHVSWSFWIIGWLAWEHREMPVNENGKTHWGSKNYVPVQMPLIQVRLWVKFLLESPAISLIFQAKSIQLIYRGMFYPAFFLCACKRSFETASCKPQTLVVFKSPTTKMNWCCRFSPNPSGLLKNKLHHV